MISLFASHQYILSYVHMCVRVQGVDGVADTPLDGTLTLSLTRACWKILLSVGETHSVIAVTVLQLVVWWSLLLLFSAPE